MTQQSRVDYLSFLLNEIAAMSIVKCRMANERIVRLGDSKQPVFSPATSGNFKRVGLCSPEVRAERLGCSHTMSRSKLDGAIDELGSSVAEHLRHELNWLTNEIHLLDHKKGEAETQQARAERETKVQREDTRALELLKASALVKELERQHDGYVERIGLLRDKVISELDKEMKSLINNQ
jgi:hypothetical protein